jgi:uncharacterized protein YkwD
MELQVVALTNDLRQQHGCAPLQASSALTTAAHDHSQEMADHNYFDHVDLSGHHSDWRAQQAGYTGNAGWENIAAGYPTAEAVVAGWYNETPPNDGHRRNLLNCALTEIGVGATTNAQSDYNTYWTQDFGQRAADAPTAQDAAAMPVDEPITVEAAVMLPIDEPIRVEAAVMLPGEDKHELEK